MSFKTATVVLASAVAQNGTFTVQYPTDTTAGDFVSYGHKMWAAGLQSLFSQDLAGMSVSFGASDITVTYKGATSIPAGSRVTVELNQTGQNDREQSSSHALDLMKRMTMSPLVQIDLGAPDAADDNGIVESQNLTSAGVYSVLAFNGVYGDPYGNDYAVLDVPRNVVAGWTGTAVLTVTGLDEYGDVIVESSASSTSFTGKKAFKRVTSIAVSANVTSLTVGTGDVLGLPVFIEKIEHVRDYLENGVSKPSGHFTLQVTSPSLADAGQVYAVSPLPAEIVTAYAVTNTAVATADAGITVKTAGGTVGTITIALSGSAVGVVDVISGVANADVAAGGTVEFENDAAASAGIADYIALMKAKPGVLTAGVQTAPTATTGDVRGTYDPVTACDGSTTFSIIARLADPKYRGVDNYDG